MIANPLALLLIIVIVIVTVAAIIEMVMNYYDRKGWINGVEYDVEEFEDLWVIARMVADSDRNEFDVAYNPEDGYFYDRDSTGYHPTEIYIKKNYE